MGVAEINVDVGQVLTAAVRALSPGGGPTDSFAESDIIYLQELVSERTGQPVSRARVVAALQRRNERAASSARGPEKASSRPASTAKSSDSFGTSRESAPLHGGPAARRAASGFGRPDTAGPGSSPLTFSLRGGQAAGRPAKAQQNSQTPQVSDDRFARAKALLADGNLRGFFDIFMIDNAEEVQEYARHLRERGDQQAEFQIALKDLEITLTRVRQRYDRQRSVVAVATAGGEAAHEYKKAKENAKKAADGEEIDEDATPAEAATRALKAADDVFDLDALDSKRDESLNGAISGAATNRQRLRAEILELLHKRSDDINQWVAVLQLANID